jgi:hypothetical protein
VMGHVSDDATNEMANSENFRWGYSQIVTNKNQITPNNFYFFKIPFTYEKRCN